MIVNYPAIILLVALCGWLVFSHYQKKRKRRRELEAAATDRQWKLDAAEPVMRGAVDGMDVCFRLTTRGDGSSGESFTECDVTVASDWLVLDVKPVSDGDAQARRVKVADDSFHDHFVVEAAPVVAARRILNKKLRQLLIELHPVAIEQVDNGLRLAKRGWLEDADAIRSFVDAAAVLGRRVEKLREAHQDARQRAGLENAALSGYRGASREALETTSADVAELRAHRAERTQRRKQSDTATGAILLVLIVVIAIVADQAGC